MERRIWPPPLPLPPPPPPPSFPFPLPPPPLSLSYSSASPSPLSPPLSSFPPPPLLTPPLSPSVPRLSPLPPLTYKPEHAVDLDTGVVVPAPIHPAYQGDTTTPSPTLEAGPAILPRSGSRRARTNLRADR